MDTAMIWSATGGIGRALVQRLMTEGWTVFAMTRHGADIAELTPHVIEADVSSPFEVQSAITAASQEVTAISLWIYAIGDIFSAKTTETSPDDWRRILDANLTGAFLATHHSPPLLADDAHLIYLGAISERLRLPGISAYAAAKAGLEAFADSPRKEERHRRVTVVRPAAVNTSLWDKSPVKVPPGALSPDEAATRILAAHRDGHRGLLDM